MRCGWQRGDGGFYRAERPRYRRQVRKTPSWPRNWADCSLLQLCSHRNAWANRCSLGQPETLSRSSGHLYISDQGNSRIRRVDARTGIITTIAGGDRTGMLRDGLAVEATFAMGGAVTFVRPVYDVRASPYKINRAAFMKMMLPPTARRPSGIGAGSASARATVVSAPTAGTSSSATARTAASAGWTSARAGSKSSPARGRAATQATAVRALVLHNLPQWS